MALSRRAVLLSVRRQISSFSSLGELTFLISTAQMEVVWMAAGIMGILALGAIRKRGKKP